MDNPSYPPPPEPPMMSAPPPARVNDRGWAAITSLVLGVVNLCAWFFPICGGPMAVVGIIFGALGLGSSRRGLAIAGLVLGVVGLCLSIGNAAFGAYLGLSGFNWQDYLQP
jgi:hypothetical protein